MILCLRGSEQLEKLNDEEIAFALKISVDELNATKEIFIKKCFIDSQWNVLQWEKRQYISDDANSRVKKYRYNMKNNGQLSSYSYTKHRVTVYSRDNNLCVYCGSSKSLCLDHLYPVRLGGDDNIDNLVTACKKCNSGKSGRTVEQIGYSFFNKLTEDQYKKVLLRLQVVTVTVTRCDNNKKDDEKILEIEKKNDEKEKSRVTVTRLENMSNWHKQTSTGINQYKAATTCYGVVTSPDTDTDSDTDTEETKRQRSTKIVSSSKNRRNEKKECSKKIAYFGLLGFSDKESQWANNYSCKIFSVKGWCESGKCEEIRNRYLGKIKNRGDIKSPIAYLKKSINTLFNENSGEIEELIKNFRSNIHPIDANVKNLISSIGGGVK
jgi:hypothetical protein